MPTRPCWVEIRTRSLEENYRYLLSLAAGQAELLAIVKANAYGHSLELCAPAAVRAGANWLGVTSVEEGAQARALCPDARILVIGGVFRGQGRTLIEYGLTAVVWQLDQLDELESAAREMGLRGAGLPVHLEIDTGMSRQGASLESLGPMLARLSAESPLKLEGVMTHLFAADEADNAVTELQLQRLDEGLKMIAAAGLRPEWLNVGNSAALLSGAGARIAALAASHGMTAMLRPGLALYGLAPKIEASREWAALQHALSWKTEVVGTRTIPAGAVVGYNGTFVATEPMRLALLAVGYGDGLDRKLGNNFSLLVRGERAPIVGRISMDQTVVDVTEIDGVQAGDEVVILGTQGAETITAYDHAEALGTIPWEIFTRIAARVRRVAV